MDDGLIGVVGPLEEVVLKLSLLLLPVLDMLDMSDGRLEEDEFMDMEEPDRGTAEVDRARDEIVLFLGTDGDWEPDSDVGEETSGVGGSESLADRDPALPSTSSDSSCHFRCMMSDFVAHCTQSAR